MSPELGPIGLRASKTEVLNVPSFLLGFNMSENIRATPHVPLAVAIHHRHLYLSSLKRRWESIYRVTFHPFGQQHH
jgi:hypothetical protein